MECLVGMTTLGVLERILTKRAARANVSPAGRGYGDAGGKKGSLAKERHCPFLWQSPFAKPNRVIFEESTIVPMREGSRYKHSPGRESETAPSVATSAIKFLIPLTLFFPRMDIVSRERQENQPQFFWGTWPTYRRPRQGKRKT